MQYVGGLLSTEICDIRAGPMTGPKLNLKGLMGVIGFKYVFCSCDFSIGAR